MTNETILTNAKLVLSSEVLAGTIRFKDGVIAGIDAGPSSVSGAIDCDGDLVLPGLVELHTDNLERHIEPRPKVNWPHSAAILAHDGELASVGITTVFDALRVGSIPEGKGRYLKYARQVASEIAALRDQGALRIRHLLHLRAEVCSETLAEELDEFSPHDQIGIVSLMDHTPGQRQFRDLSKLKAYVAKKNAMNDAEFEEHVRNLERLRAVLGEEHERATVSAANRLGAVLASHDDTTSDQVAQSAAQGVSFAEFPTTLEAAAACRVRGIAVMMGAPNLIRGGSHSGNIAASDLADAGLLDIVSSDYVPSSLLTSALALGDLWGDVARGVATVTSAPASAARLTDRGRLESGLAADVIRVKRIGTSAAVRGVWVGGQRVS
jgi:alpha-D-ribose 1-methylphosphonate 5-triphosphate diphosphatase